MLLAGGSLALLGAVMIIPLFVPSRWRGGRARYGRVRPAVRARAASVTRAPRTRTVVPESASQRRLALSGTT